MGSKNKAPPPPDYAPIAAASSASAQYSFELGKEQLAWARETYAKDSARADRNEETIASLIKDAMGRQDVADSQAARDRDRYEQIFQPLEESLVRESEGYTDQRNRQRAETAAGRATADVSAQFASARAAAQDRLESFGIDPSQIRSQALDLSARTAEAVARAAAANQTREQVQRAEEATGRALRSEAVNIGRGYPGQIAAQHGLAMQSGTGAANMGFGNVNAGLATTASGANTMGTGVQWQGAGNTALGTWGNALTQGHNARMEAYKADKGGSGWGTALGAGLGLLATPLKGTALGALFAEGGAVPHEGVPITAEMSPTMGAAVDDVPARLTPGEFVVPEDVVRWKGEEFFQRTIEASRKKRQDAPAKPKVQAVPMQAPVVNTAQAVPLG